MRINFGAGPFFEPGEIARVIEMTVRQKNGLDRLRRQAKPPDESPDENWFAEQTRLNHHAVVAVRQQETAAHDAADAVKVWRNIAHGECLSNFPVATEFKKSMPG
jgi:hypothetical protein